jgi:ferrous iron transport protein A
VVTNAIPLQSLPAGQSASILRILGHPDDVHRLEEFGIRRGTRVEMFRAGTPCILRIAGNKFCLRADDLVHVFVEPIEAMLRPRPAKNVIQREGAEITELTMANVEI